MSAPQDAATQRRRNLRLGLILASIALTFLGGFVAKITLMGG